MKKTVLILCILVIAVGLCFAGAEAYYGSYYGGLYGGYGLYGGLMGGYGLYGGYGGLMGLYGGYGGLLGGYSMYGGLMGLYGGYGGLMGLYGGYGMYGGYSPFSFNNLYYPVETAGGLTYQVPYLQIAPLLGVAGLYNQLFPNLFNPQPQIPPIVNVSTPTSLGVTFPTPVNVLTVT